MPFSALRFPRYLGALLGALLAPGCGAVLVPSLPVGPPPLIAMEEPARYLQEPEDEEQRRDLDPGAFSGIEVGDARDSLEALLEAPLGLEVQTVVPNSPGQAAGLAVGDLLLEYDAGDGAQPLEWPSQWRDLELELTPGQELWLLYDRAGVEFETTLTLSQRTQPAEREDARRYREEERVGVVLRTPTEVEARSAGLAPGAGAVVVGLDRASPWRRAGIQYEDLIVRIAGQDVHDPQVVLDVLREAKPKKKLRIEVLRGSESVEFTSRSSRRKTQLREAYIPLVFSYEADADGSETSMLLGLIKWRRTPAAWRVRLLWLIRFGGGDTDELIEVDG